VWRWAVTVREDDVFPILAALLFSYFSVQK
jgi:hypothetical protein